MISWPGLWSALVTLPVPADASAIDLIVALEARLRDRLGQDFETVPAFNRLLVTAPPEQWDADLLEKTVSEAVSEVLANPPAPNPPTHIIAFPACYDPDLAPDLTALASRIGATTTEVGRLHAEQVYTVLATGFSPGFAYLGDIHPSLSTPRRPDPRRRVETGSIGIADRRTAVYPAAGPGGWQLIGRVPAPLFQDTVQRLTRFSPGLKVRFNPISRADYERES